ncbi:hypothetical protein BDZ89DRAFT_1134597 [Hymenopellis radicata]|nr:hypothetical protein BDZ89DRAFT_1134597 [Hymenopellis radicata]
MQLPQPFPTMFAGACISLALFGIVITQTWNYFNNFPKDNIRLKAFVVTVFTLDLASTVFLAMWSVVRLFIVRWADESFLDVLHWTLFMDPILLGVIASFVHIFFALRINVLLGQWWIPAVIAVLALTTLCGGVASGVMALHINTFDRLHEIRPYLAVWLWPAAVADIIIALSMSYYLYQHKERINSTEQWMDRATGVLVQNGSITAVVAVINAILFVSSDVPYHLAISFIMPKLYANMTLSSLHSRKVIVRPEVIAVPSAGGVFTTSTYGGNRGRTHQACL